MSKLIALVVIAVGAGTERVTIQPGEEVTGLTAKDVDALKASGAIADEDDQAADEKTAAKVEKAAAADFAKARKAVLAT
jgi:hypothetical protein